jgi:hypothetical protein
MYNPKFGWTVVVAVIVAGLMYGAAKMGIEIPSEVIWSIAMVIMGFIMRYTRNWITPGNKEDVEALLDLMKKK